MRWVMDFILGVRQIRGEMDIRGAASSRCLLQNAGASDSSIWGAICTTCAPRWDRAAGVLAAGRNGAHFRRRIVGQH